MSLTTEEIIGGMYRAHQAGQPFAALVANPQFASLPLEQKKQVLAGLRQRMGGETSSTANTLTTMIKGTAGGALSGLPLGVAVPLALELSQGDGGRKGVLQALKFAAGNKSVKVLVGTGMALGAAGGLLNSAFSLHQAKKDKETFKKDLQEASHGGEALAAASFGAIGVPGSARHLNVTPVVRAISDTAIPNVLASARFGYHAAEFDKLRNTDKDAELIQTVSQRVRERGIPLDADRVSEIIKQLQKGKVTANALHSVVVNSPRELGIDPEAADSIAQETAEFSQNTDDNIANFNVIEQYARQLRDMKRGAN